MKRRQKGTGCVVKMRDTYYGRIVTGGKVKLVRLSKNQREANRIWADWLAKNQTPFHPRHEIEPACCELSNAWQVLEIHFKARGNTPAVLDNYHRHFNQFLQWVTNRGKTKLENVTEDDVRLCLAECTKGKSNCLKRNFRYVLKSLWEVVLPSVPNPTRNIKFDWQEQNPREPLTNSELEAILEVARKSRAGDEVAALIQVAVYTGLRRKDCVYLDTSDICNGVIELSPYKTKKRGIHVRIPIHASLQKVLDSLKVDRHGRFFPSLVREYERGLLQPRLQRIFSKVVKTSVSKEGRARRVPFKTFHSLRATFITRLAESNVNLDVIRTLVGHTRLETTLHYCHQRAEFKTRAIETLNFETP